MGSVWLAERIDGALKRNVALKLPHLVSKRTGLAERMARERDILGALAHPHVAHLYDAGITTEGRPFLALEYVEGVRIDEYCRERQLDVAARVELILQVANAVAYAHAKLVIHRDIKPANILVTADGSAKLLDFGVAKLLEDGQASSTHLTELSGRALTPHYASPEQIMGEPLTIATDIYSLGVVMFELLTGQRPHCARRETRAALEEAILNEEIPRPSEVTTGKARKQLRGDLDTIVLKALKRQPHARYTTAPALIDDLRRWAAHEPVLAQPDSRWYRFTRFVVRNKAAVGAACAISLAVVVGAAAALWQARSAIRERDRAAEVTEFITSIFREASPYQSAGQALTGRELLHIASARIAKLPQERAELRAELHNVVGSSLLSLEDLEGAEKVLKQSLIDHALPSTHAEALERRRLLAETYIAKGDVKAARAELDAIMPIVRSEAVDRPESLLSALGTLVKLENTDTRFEAAQSLAEEGLAIAARHGMPPSADLVTLLTGLRYSFRQRGNELDSLAPAQRAYDTALQLQNGDRSHPLVLSARLAYALSLADNARIIEAANELEPVLSGTERAFGAQNRQLGVRLSSTAEIFGMAGRLQEAQQNVDRGAQILAQYHDAASRPIGVTTEVQGLAKLASRHGDEAAALIGRAHRILERHYGAEHWMSQRIKRNHALAIALAGDLATAERQLTAVMERFPVFEAEEFDRNSHFLGIIKRLSGEHEIARARLQRSLDSLPNKPLAAWERMHIEVELGLALLALNRYEAAERTITRALAAMAERRLPMTPARADALVALGQIALHSGNPQLALEHLQPADEYWKTLNPRSRWAGEAMLWLGRAHLALGQEAEGRNRVKGAVELLSNSTYPVDLTLVRGEIGTRL